MAGPKREAAPPWRDLWQPEAAGAWDRLLRALRRRALGISPREVSFARRGFHAGSATARARLEGVGRAFLQGYHAALEADPAAGLPRRLGGVAAELRGFAYEGAAMALALLDGLAFGRRRLTVLLAKEGASHAYMVHVGVGWALARLPFTPGPLVRCLDPLLRWLAFDGYGFHQGYFHPRRAVSAREVPGRLRGYQRRAFDQGLGRSLWFVDGADPARLAATTAAFPPSRRPDLWSGIGLAAAYAGGVEAPELVALRRWAGPFRAHLAQGAAFAAKARQRAGNPAAHTELACRLLCGRSAGDAARITDAALENLPPDREEPRYETWRRRVREGLEAGGGA